MSEPITAATTRLRAALEGLGDPPIIALARVGLAVLMVPLGLVFGAVLIALAACVAVAAPIAGPVVFWRGTSRLSADGEALALEVDPSKPVDIYDPVTGTFTRAQPDGDREP
jgi:hypothetical protein